ncbi:folate-binding protein YgfZ [Cellvibrio sp. KY-YJ-3]|uniref:CAF17-like 4Fe-4S cluster assembly/insertion protein YgfZ n=1 Tax=Cellvibrio sp. KY-YJ-3 TaxID=454662 RepID=UPI001246CFAC|nr:folate-binding protein YgfZ [Cellvibrio sp. KY-YJ-3]QEY13493.1 folate-binding protein [Cellvibrio sp. KY-YJ-3]
MPNPDLSTMTYLATLTNKQLLLVKGPDAGKFLQGQVTCDVKELNEPVTRLGAQCNPKGRILLSFRALQMNNETIALRLPANMMESAQKTLGKYIVFSKAKLQDGGNDFALFGLFGDSAATVASTFFQQLPTTYEGWIEKDGSYLIQLAANRFECWVATATVDSFLDAIEKQTQKVSADEWQLLDIAAGIGEVYPESYELFTPQELNYQLVNGINFRKGCYTGQEIVARLHYRGKLKRHMYRFEYKNDQTPPPGTTIINSLSGQNAGTVVMAALNQQGKIELLASLLDEQIDQAKVESATEKLSQLSLPYAIPTAEEATQ